MSLSVTKNQEQNSFNPLKWGAYGAGGGVIARSLLPVTSKEKEIFSEIIAERKPIVKSKVETVLSEIRENMKNATVDERPAYDIYLKYSDPELAKNARPLIGQEAEKLPEIARKKFFELKKHVDSIVAEAKNTHNFIARSVIKESRSLFNFVSIGALLAVGTAFVSYVLTKMASEPK